MNNSFSLQQIQKTSNLDANLISRQSKLNLMAVFLKVTNENPRMKQSEIANQIGLSTSTLQRYRNDINMLSSYRINSNNNHKRTKNVKNTDFDNDSHHETDVKRPQMTSNGLKRPQSTSNENSKKTKTKNNLKAGSIQENIEIYENYLDKVLKNNDRRTLICVIIIVYPYSSTSMAIII